MADTSSVVTTTAAAMTASQAAAPIQWALDGFPHPVPQSVSLCLAAALIPLVHAFYSWVNRRLQSSSAAPAAPATPQS